MRDRLVSVRLPAHLARLLDESAERRGATLAEELVSVAAQVVRRRLQQRRRSRRVGWCDECQATVRGMRREGLCNMHFARHWRAARSA
jgi:hypothetical protein